MERPMAFPDLMRTDLALEAREAVRARDGEEVDGVDVDVEEDDDIRITRMEIRTDAAANRLGKAKGKYTTLEAPRLREEDRTFLPRVVDRLASELHRYFEDFGIGPDDLVLVVGLGNRDVTPDALGPEVVARVHVTNHLFAAEGVDLSGFRPVAAVAPGFWARRGLKREKSSPRWRAPSPPRHRRRRRLARPPPRAPAHDGTTLGHGDRTGIGSRDEAPSAHASGARRSRPCRRDSHGRGCRDDRGRHAPRPRAFDWAAFGVGDRSPSQAAPRLPRRASRGLPSSVRESEPVSEVRQAILGFLGELSDDERHSLFVEVLGPVEYNFIVTPKDIDAFVDRAATVLASALNRALHPDVTEGNYGVF